MTTKLHGRHKKSLNIIRRGSISVVANMQELLELSEFSQKE